ncbi:MAG: rhomboid family intramembrane serine protease [Halalkalicoccus sp.]
MPVTPTRVALVVALLAALVAAWYADGRGRWRAAAADRLLYGVPWGTAVTVSILVAFYLVVQGGLYYWNDPVAIAFVTWSYFYPTGLLTAGIAHAGPAHLLSNVTGTVVFGAIAEYVWGHYPSSRDAGERDPSAETRTLRVDGGRRGLLSRPWLRAVVAFPAALFGAAFLTAVFSLGPGLGFSGAVFALVGFALVSRPLATVVGVTVAATLSLLGDALARPVVRETVEVGPPVPPEWAGIGFHAHLLGFLLGALVAAALLSRRRRRPSFAAIAFGVLVVGSTQALWLLVWSTGVDEHALYQGIGVTMVLTLALVIAEAVAGSDRGLPRPLGRFDRVPSRRTLAIAWLGAVAIGLLAGLVGVFVVGEAVALSAGLLVVLAAVLAVPGLVSVVPDRVFPTPTTRRHAAVTCLVVVTFLLAMVSVPVGLTAVGEDAMPEAGAVTAGDYAVTYEEDATSGRESTVDVGDEEALVGDDVSGVIVVSDERELWTVAVSEAILAFEGEETVTVGGVGWRETIHVERTGWEVLGDDTAYAVDLSPEDDETTRAFTSDPVEANAEIDGRTVAVVPTDDEFDLAVRADGETVGTAPIPEVGGSTNVGALSFTTVEDGDTVRVLAEADDVRIAIAERETYP